MSEAVKETKAQRIERLKREKNAWECLDEIRAFSRNGHGSIPPEWLGTYFRFWGVYTQGDGVGAVGGTDGEGKAIPYFMVRLCSTQTSGSCRMSAKVYLVGAGPGDPDLLTVKAVRILRSADIVLHDALVSEAVLQIARPNAQLIDVGKRMGNRRLTQDAINQLLVDLAGCANVIVRLKGGDPAIFGRAAEEMSAVRQAGIEFEVVPGITAAIAAAAQAGITLTDRQSAAGVAFLTAQQAAGKGRTNIARYVSQDCTLAIYMPAGQYREIRDDLIAAGLTPDTPCLVVANASRPNQELLWTDIAALGSIIVLGSPALIIIGSVASSHNEALVCSTIHTVGTSDGAGYIGNPPRFERETA